MSESPAAAKGMSGRPDFSKGYSPELEEMMSKMDVMKLFTGVKLGPHVIDQEMPGGTTMKVAVVNGKSCPMFCTPRRMKEVQEMNVKDDDIFLVSYPKSGTHWFTHVVRQVIGCPVKQVFMLDAELPFPFSFFDTYPTPRLLTTHITANYIPEQLLKSKAKVILTVRNPKDTVVSMYNHLIKMPDPLTLRCSWSEYFEQIFTDENTMFYDNHLRHMQQWLETFKDHKDRLHLLVFEDMKLKPEETLDKLAAFLGVEMGEDKKRDVMEKTSLTALREASQMKFIYRKGEIGDWKNWFTVAPSERADEFIKKWNQKLNYDFTYSS